MSGILLDGDTVQRRRARGGMPAPLAAKMREAGASARAAEAEANGRPGCARSSAPEASRWAAATSHGTSAQPPPSSSPAPSRASSPPANRFPHRRPRGPAGRSISCAMTSPISPTATNAANTIKANRSVYLGKGRPPSTPNRADVLMTIVEDTGRATTTRSAGCCSTAFNYRPLRHQGHGEPATSNFTAALARAWPCKTARHPRQHQLLHERCRVRADGSTEIVEGPLGAGRLCRSPRRSATCWVSHLELPATLQPVQRLEPDPGRAGSRGGP